MRWLAVSFDTCLGFWFAASIGKDQKVASKQPDALRANPGNLRHTIFEDIEATDLCESLTRVVRISGVASSCGPG